MWVHLQNGLWACFFYGVCDGMLDGVWDGIECRDSAQIWEEDLGQGLQCVLRRSGLQWGKFQMGIGMRFVTGNVEGVRDEVKGKVTNRT